ncbi:MAG: ABC transporter substrate-binding protein [Desulfovermiculus sp.]|nr:ABC transporter substrate-binding protein [Desulfovermiculus sp.]
MPLTKKPCRVHNLAMIIFLPAILLLWAVPGAGGQQVREVRIADSKGDWGYPNPYQHYPRGPGYVRMSWIFDTLVWKDQGGYVPALAESWSYDDQEQAFTFQLQPDAKWHDGRPVTAQDVAFTVQYFQKYPYYWISVQDIEEVETRGEHEVVMQLKRPYSAFISDVGGTMPLLPQHIWESVEDPRKFVQPEAFIGSGPYKFADFSKEKGSYLFRAFEDYYQGKPMAKRLIYVRSGQPMVSLATGQVDLASIQPQMAKRLEKQGLEIIKNERGWNKKLMINHRQFPGSEKRFRQALAYAIDRHELVDKTLQGFGQPASYGLLSEDHGMYTPDLPEYGSNPDKARAMLEDLGFEMAESGFYARNGEILELELLTSDISTGGQREQSRDGEVLQKQLEAAGIKIDLVNMEQTSTDNKVKNWDFDLAISGHGGVSGDPRILNEMISSKYGAGSVNSARYDTNPELNELLEEQLQEMDQDKRKEIVMHIQKLYARELPAISLYYPDTLAAYNPDKGIHWFYTRGGISKGIPIPQNKMALIRDNAGN